MTSAQGTSVHPAILVTGCAGFIGHKVCELLLEDGYQVVGVDNLNDAYAQQLKQWRLDQIQQRSGFHFQRLDVEDLQALQALFSQQPGGFAAVINLAARAGVRYSVENPWAYIQTNVTGTLNLLEMCRQQGTKKFVLASTSSLYGSKNARPFREDAITDGPLSPYAASKKAAEALAHSYHHLHGLDVTVFRYFTVYGPAGRPDMSAFRFVQWISEGRPVTIYGDGQQSRDFTYVDDIARGTIAGLRPLGYEVINLGSDAPVRLSEVLALIESLTGRKAGIRYTPRHPADMLATWADIGKARRLLNWQPTVYLEEGIRRLIDWYQTNRAWAKDIETG